MGIFCFWRTFLQKEKKNIQYQEEILPDGKRHDDAQSHFILPATIGILPE